MLLAMFLQVIDKDMLLVMFLQVIDKVRHVAGHVFTGYGQRETWRAFFFFFNGGNTEGTNSSKILCLMFVYVSVALCQD